MNIKEINEIDRDRYYNYLVLTFENYEHDIGNDVSDIIYKAYDNIDMSFPLYSFVKGVYDIEHELLDEIYLSDNEDEFVRKRGVLNLLMEVMKGTIQGGDNYIYYMLQVLGEHNK